MNINNLKSIIALEYYGSISEAAKHLFFSQPYLSKVLRETEEEYNIKIFRRTSKGLEITPLGMQFVDMAKGVVQQKEAFDRAFDRKYSVSTVRIASFPSTYSMHAYIKMSKSDPELKIESYYKEESTIDVINDVFYRSAEVGVIFLKDTNQAVNKDFFESRKIDLIKIKETSPHIIVRAGHPLLNKEHVTIDDLYEYNLVAFASKYGTGIYSLEDGYYNRTSMDEIIDFDRFKKIHYIYTRGTMHSIIKQSDCIAIGNHINSKNLEPFGIHFIPLKEVENTESPEKYNNSLYVIHSSDQPLSKLAKTYIRFLKEEMEHYR